MSANNYIKIRKDETAWLIEHRDMDTGQLIEKLGSSADLESAIRQANAFMEVEEVEYGLSVDVEPVHPLDTDKQ